MNYAKTFALLVCFVGASPAFSQDALETLIARVPEVAQGGAGIGPREVELAKQFHLLGPAAVPCLIEMLDAPQLDVRRFAGYVLRDQPGVNRNHLDRLIAACRDGDRWIAPAIGRIATPEAVVFLIEQLKKEPEQGQVSYALQIAGAPAVPAVVQLYQNGEVENFELAGVLEAIFADWKEVAAGAVEPLISVAENASYSERNRRAAIYALAAIGASSRAIVPRLKTLARESLELSTHAERAVMAIGSPDAVDVYVRELRGRPSIILLRDLADAGSSVRDAGIAVVPLLKHADWDIRVAAANCLGYIDYQPSARKLIEALGSEEDWRLVYAASRALGRMRPREAIAPLQLVAEKHWFPAVRATAAHAIQVIEGRARYESRFHPQNFAFEFFDYTMVGEQNAEPRRQLKFAAQEGTYSTPELLQVRYQVKSSDGNSRTRDSRFEQPTCGFRLPQGSLFGNDRGEWGGELVFVGLDGTAHRLIGENTRAIHRLGDHVVALTGLAHITFNDGYVHRIEFPESGVPTTARWRVLPGAPLWSAVLESGELLVECVSGTVVIDLRGNVKMAE